MALALAAAVLAALGYAAGSILQAVGVRGGSGAAALTRSPLYLTGLGVDGLAWLLSLVALRRLPTFAVQSLLAGSLALTVVLARMFLGSRLRPRDTAAVLALVAALGVVGGAGTEQPSPTVATPLQVVLLVAGALLLAAVLVLRRFGSAAFAVLAGLGYSVAALSARAVTLPDAWSDAWRVLAEPVAWAVVVAGVAGTLGYAAALEKGPVGPATALLWSVEVVVPAVAGFLLLGDVVRPGWWVPTVAALVVVVGCSVVLAGSPGQLPRTRALRPSRLALPARPGRLPSGPDSPAGGGPVPESRIRRRRAWTAPREKSAGPRPSPRWWVPTMITLMVVGLVWIVTYYISAATYPVPQLGYWNLAVGFGVVLVGFGMTTRWR